VKLENEIMKTQLFKVQPIYKLESASREMTEESPGVLLT
jgi:hypothetical protein